MSRPLRAIAALAISGLLLAGCATPPNTAAVVNGERFTETMVSDGWVALAPVVVETAGPSIMVESLIQNAILEPVAESYGIVASDEEVQAFAEVVFDGEAPDPLPEATKSVLSFIVLMNTLNVSPLAGEIQQTYLAAVQDADIRVNPRFGTVNEIGTLIDPAFDWIATSY